jgi:hypothetical protein
VNVLDEHVVVLLILGMQMLMASVADVEMLACLERVVEGNDICVFASAAVAFSSAESALEDCERVLILSDGVVDLIFCEDA